MLRKLISLTTLVIFAVIIIAGSIGLELVRSQPRFCNSCHEMNSYYSSWQNSTHATKAVCLNCHSQPGLQGFISENVRGAEQIAAHFSGNYSVPIQIVARVKNEQCLACHPETRNISDKTIKAKHSLHMDKNVLCADCHNRLVHNHSGQPRVISTAQCDLCHRAQCHHGSYNGTSAMCVGCHEPPPSHAGMDTDCAQCHTADGFTPSTFVHQRVGEHIGGRGERPLSCVTCHPVQFIETTCTGSRCHSSNNGRGGDD